MQVTCSAVRVCSSLNTLANVTKFNHIPFENTKIKATKNVRMVSFLAVRASHKTVRQLIPKLLQWSSLMDRFRGSKGDHCYTFHVSAFYTFQDGCAQAVLFVCFELGKWGYSLAFLALILQLVQYSSRSEIAFCYILLRLENYHEIFNKRICKDTPPHFLLTDCLWIVLFVYRFTSVFHLI